MPQPVGGTRSPGPARPAPAAPSDAAAPVGWVIRLYEAADEVFWAAKLNLLWLLGTLAGGILLGIGPATLAAYTVARRHCLDGSPGVVAAFRTAYRKEFGRGSLLVLPLAGAATLLVVNYFSFGAAGAGPGLRVATVVALGALVAIAAYLLPMAVHYELPARALLPKASLFALTRPAPTVLLLFVFAAVAYAVLVFPFLGPVLAAGGWIRLDTWLCLRFFAENEARLRAESIS